MIYFLRVSVVGGTIPFVFNVHKHGDVRWNRDRRVQQQ